MNGGKPVTPGQKKEAKKQAAEAASPSVQQPPQTPPQTSLQTPQPSPSRAGEEEIALVQAELDEVALEETVDDEQPRAQVKRNGSILSRLGIKKKKRKKPNKHRQNA